MSSQSCRTRALAYLLSLSAYAVGPALAEGGAIGKYPARVYVPNNKSDTLHVIDPQTYRIIATYPMGREPHHVTPSWDLSVLYVNNTQGNTLTLLDPMTGAPSGEVSVIDPYNLYFTPDGRHAVVVAERYRRLDIRDPVTWKLRKSVPVPQAGVNHLAFSRGGAYLVASTEFTGWLVKIDLERLEVIEEMEVGGSPVDVFRPPGQTLMYVANQGLNGVHVLDPERWLLVGFIETGKGAHGIHMSRDGQRLFVSNRLAGTISVIDLATDTVSATWETGGSPDMGQLSPDGRELWISSRYHADVRVIDTDTGRVIAKIPTDNGPHGLTYFPNSPQPHSLGHNGIYLEPE